MRITPTTRKPVDKLKPSDFGSFPIWEFAIDEEEIDGQDETWVRPVKSSEIPLDSYSQIVAADFTTSNGKKLSGFMDVTTAEESMEVRPGVIVGAEYYLVLPIVSREEAVAKSYTWSLNDRHKLAQTLLLTETELFPIKYKLRVCIRGETKTRDGVVV